MDEICLRIATTDDAERIAEIMREVYERLEDKSLFICDDLDFVRAHIKEQGRAVVACHAGGRIIGSLILRYPSEAEDNLGRDIGLNDRLGEIVHVESTVVLPAYRGRGLQYRMLTIAEALIDQSRYSYLLCTVSPDNPASCKTFEKAGFEYIATKEKYGGFTRRIYQKKL